MIPYDPIRLQETFGITYSKKIYFIVKFYLFFHH